MGLAVEAPGGDEVVGVMRALQPRRQQLRMDRHRLGDAAQCNGAHPVRVGRRGLQRQRRAHRMADQGGLRHTGGVQQGGDPVCLGLDAVERRALGLAVARQVDREHAAPVPGEIAGLQLPDRAVHAAAVQENDGVLRRIEIPAAGRAVDAPAVDGEFHGFAPPKPRGASARPGAPMPGRRSGRPHPPGRPTGARGPPRRRRPSMPRRPSAGASCSPGG